MLRYIRAFFKALAITLRGETLPSPAEQRHPRLFKWQRTANDRLAAVFEVAQAQGYNEQQRKTTTVRIEGRDLSMETILASVQYHLNEEYPYLLKHPTEHTLTALYASNINDRYWMAQLAQLEGLPPPLRDAIAALSSQLEAIPPSTEDTGESA